MKTVTLKDVANLVVLSSKDGLSITQQGNMDIEQVQENFFLLTKRKKKDIN